MALSLAKLLELDPQAKRYLVFSANEEQNPLLIYVLEHLYRQCGAGYVRKSYSADRFFNCQELTELLRTNSLFGDKYFIQLEFKTKPTAEQQAQLLNLSSFILDEHVLLVSCNRLDKKDLSGKWATAAQAADQLVIIYGSDNEALTWLRHWFSCAQIAVEAAGLKLLLELNYNNWPQLAQEVSRLCLLVEPGSSLDLSTIRAQLSDNAQFNVFTLADAYLSGKFAEAKRILVNIYRAPEDAILIMWSLTEDLRKLLQLKGELKNNASLEQALAGLRVRSEQLANYRAAHLRLSYSRLIAAYAELAELDCIIKGLKPGNIVLKLEQLIKTLCSRGG